MHEYQKVLSSIHEDVLQLRQLTKNLLEIAKTSGSGSIELDEVRIDELLMKVIADVKRLNPSYMIEMEFGEFSEESECMVFGNFDLLYIAIKNIIENGCKYSTDNRSRVVVSCSPQQLSISVSNKGDVIAEQEIDNRLRVLTILRADRRIERSCRPDPFLILRRPQIDDLPARGIERGVRARQFRHNLYFSADAHDFRDR